MNTTTVTTPFLTLWNAAFSERGFIRFDGNQTTLVGRENGKLWVRAWKNIPGLGVAVTIQEDGRNYWAARGRQGYAPAATFTILVDRAVSDSRSHRYVKISADVEVRSSEADRATADAVHRSTLTAALEENQP
jgi:hypothetical protein